MRLRPLNESHPLAGPSYINVSPFGGNKILSLFFAPGFIRLSLLCECARVCYCQEGNNGILLFALVIPVGTGIPHWIALPSAFLSVSTGRRTRTAKSRCRFTRPIFLPSPRPEGYITKEKTGGFKGIVLTRPTADAPLPRLVCRIERGAGRDLTAAAGFPEIHNERLFFLMMSPVRHGRY